MGYKKRTFFIIQLRDFYLKKIKWRKYQIGKKFHAGRNVTLWAKNQIVIGDYCYLGAGTIIGCDIEFGNYVFTARNVGFVGKNDHNYHEIGKPILFSQRIKDFDYNLNISNNKIIVEDDVWFGYGAIIMSGVKIGQGSIIAAGSVVVNDVEPFSIYAGVPAKKIKDRFNADELEKHKKIYNEKFSI